ncbi:MAG TPA: MFS transporter [Rhodospirillales bacterium]|nr:MFS transporter [Rhodospirillales bacterium]
MARLQRRTATMLFMNVGHTYAHLFLLLYLTAVLAMGDEFPGTYGEWLSLSMYTFAALGIGTLPAGWLGDRWSRRGMMGLFFIGIGASSVLLGLAEGKVGMAGGLVLIGLFSSIYHPVGTAVVVENVRCLGKAIGINGVFGNLGVALAATVTGALSDLISWRAAFIVPGGAFRGRHDLQRPHRGPAQGVRGTPGGAGGEDDGGRRLGVRGHRLRRCRPGRGRPPSRPLPVETGLRGTVFL